MSDTRDGVRLVDLAYDSLRARLVEVERERDELKEGFEFERAQGLKYEDLLSAAEAKWLAAEDRASALQRERDALRQALISVADRGSDARGWCWCAETNRRVVFDDPATHASYCRAARAALSEK